MSKSTTITQEASVTSKNMSVVVLLRAAQYPFVALFVMLVPRIMGSETYGQYALFTSIVAMVVPLVELGSTEIFGRFIPEFQRQGDARTTAKFVTGFLGLKIVVDMIVSIVLVAVLYFAYAGKFAPAYVALVVVTVFVTDLGTVPYALLFGLNRLTQYSLRDPVRRGLSLTFVLVFFHYFGLMGALASVLLVEGLLAALNFISTREYFRITYLKFSIRSLSPYLRFGFMFYLSWALMNVWQRLGNALIDYATGDSRQVGLFDIANQFFLVSTTFTLIVTNSLIPILTHLLLADKGWKLINWCRLILKYTQIAVTVVFASFVILGPNVVPLFIGSQYAETYPNGVVLLAAVFPSVVAQVGLVLSTVYKQPERYFQSLCIALAAFLAACLVLIPRFAAMGCAIATLISCFVQAVAVCIFFRDKLLAGVGDGIRAILPGVLLVPLLFLQGGWATNLALLAVFMLSYGLLLFWSGVLNPAEVRQTVDAIRHKQAT